MLCLEGGREEGEWYTAGRRNHQDFIETAPPTMQIVHMLKKKHILVHSLWSMVCTFIVESRPHPTWCEMTGGGGGGGLCKRGRVVGRHQLGVVDRGSGACGERRQLRISLRFHLAIVEEEGGGGKWREEGRLLRISSRGGKLRPTKVDSASSSFFSSLLCEKHPTTLAFPEEEKRGNTDIDLVP